MMRNVPDVRRALLVVAALFLVLDVAAVTLLLSPAGQPTTSREADYAQLRVELAEKKHDDLPARDINTRLAIARKQIAEFYVDRLPTEYSTISETLGKMAASNHVQLAAVRYIAKAAPVKGLQQVEITVSIVGDYTSEMEFINTVEREKMLFVLSQVNFGGTQNGAMRVDLHVETYIRNAA